MFTEFAIAQKLYDDLTSSMDIEVSADEARVIDIQYIVSDSEEDINKAYNLVNSGSSFFADVYKRQCYYRSQEYFPQIH